MHHKTFWEREDKFHSCLPWSLVDQDVDFALSLSLSLFYLLDLR